MSFIFPVWKEKILDLVAIRHYYLKTAKHLLKHHQITDTQTYCLLAEREQEKIDELAAQYDVELCALITAKGEGIMLRKAG